MSATSISLTGASVRKLRRHLAGAFAARPAAVVAGIVLISASAGLIALHAGPTHLPVPRGVAIERLQRDPATAPVVAKLHWTRAVLTRLDSRHEGVWLMNGPSLVLTAVMSASGQIAADTVHVRQSYAYGSNIANDARVLALMCIVFVVMTAVWPLWRVRNLDVVVATSSVAAVVLINAGLIDRMVLVSYLTLGYFALRCSWMALGRQRAPLPSVPLYDRLSQDWGMSQRRRVLKLVLVAFALIVTMIGLSSRGVVDVGYAVMEGATAIVHGIVPYGHIPDVFHGDTYPLGSYLFYAPFAWLSPVYSVWDSADLTLLVAVAAALFVAWAVSGARRMRLRHAARCEPDIPNTAGLRASIAWLAFPPLLVTISTGTTDVALAAILVAALLLWQRPALSTTVLALGAWFKLAPIALVPLWLAPLRERQLLHACGAIFAVSALMVGTLLLLGGADAPVAMLHALGYQGTRSSANSVWTVVGSVPFQQLAQAATLALIAGSVVRLGRDDRLAFDRPRVAALAAAVLLGLQISASYWSFMYLAWIYPFLALSLLGSPQLDAFARSSIDVSRGSTAVSHGNCLVGSESAARPAT